METITEIVQPIKLLSGGHQDTGETGQGCIMNVIAYLNGEPQITDNSPCVCVTIRRPLIWFNDFLRDDERQELIPYIERAMGSTTADFAIIKHRLNLLVIFANDMATYATYASYAVATATTTAATADDAYATAAYAVYAAVATTATTAAYAAAYANADADVFREKIKAIAFAFFNGALPNTQTIPREVLTRAQCLVDLAVA